MPHKLKKVFNITRLIIRLHTNALIFVFYSIFFLSLAVRLRHLQFMAKDKRNRPKKSSKQQLINCFMVWLWDFKKRNGTTV